MDKIAENPQAKEVFFTPKQVDIKEFGKIIFSGNTNNKGRVCLVLPDKQKINVSSNIGVVLVAISKSGENFTAKNIVEGIETVKNDFEGYLKKKFPKNIDKNFIAAQINTINYMFSRHYPQIHITPGPTKERYYIERN